MNSGTPKNLLQLTIQIIREDICCGVFAEAPERMAARIKDYMAQKFSTAYLRMGAWRDGSSTRYTPEEILEILWEDLTKSLSDEERELTAANMQDTLARLKNKAGSPVNKGDE